MVALGYQLLRRDSGYLTSRLGIDGSPQPRASRLPVFPMAAPRAVGVCWGGSGKWVYFRSSSGSCRSAFVVPGITNALLRQLAAGYESDGQYHGMDLLLAGRLGAMPLAKALLMSAA